MKKSLEFNGTYCWLSSFHRKFVEGRKAFSKVRACLEGREKLPETDGGCTFAFEKVGEAHFATALAETVKDGRTFSLKLEETGYLFFYCSKEGEEKPRPFYIVLIGAETEYDEVKYFLAKVKENGLELSEVLEVYCTLFKRIFENLSFFA